MRLLLCCPELSDNSVGRAYSLGLAAATQGHHVRVIGRGGPIWSPIAETTFGRTCSLISGPGDPVALDAASEADVIISVKAWPESLGVAVRLGRHARVPVVVDVDDPDIEATLAQSTFRDLLHIRSELTPRSRHPLVLRLARDSNPLTVAFVGTVRHHKGVNELREAVRLVHERGVELVCTADPPDDARPWERWVGPSSLAEGIDLVDQADVIAIPSLSTWYGPYQFPVKLVDAMMAGRAIVASDLSSIRWALGDAGILVPPGDVDSLADALLALTDRDRRFRLGQRAWGRASREFSAAAGGTALEGVLEAAVTR